MSGSSWEVRCYLHRFCIAPGGTCSDEAGCDETPGQEGDGQGCPGGQSLPWTGNEYVSCCTKKKGGPGVGLEEPTIVPDGPPLES